MNKKNCMPWSSEIVPSRKLVPCLKVNGCDKVVSLAKVERAHDHVN